MMNKLLVVYISFDMDHAFSFLVFLFNCLLQDFIDASIEKKNGSSVVMIPGIMDLWL